MCLLQFQAKAAGMLAVALPDKRFSGRNASRFSAADWQLESLVHFRFDGGEMVSFETTDTGAKLS